MCVCVCTYVSVYVFYLCVYEWVFACMHWTKQKIKQRNYTLRNGKKMSKERKTKVEEKKKRKIKEKYPKVK